MSTRLQGPSDLKSCSSPGDLLSYLGQLVHSRSGLSQFGSFTPSVYDSAWLSMVHRRQGSQLQYLFPDCFEYVLSLQQDNGCWPGYASSIDGIINTAAGLLSLLVRKSHISKIHDQGDPPRRIAQAILGLTCLLEKWDVSKGDQVGFEIIIPSLLQQILQFNIKFEFPGQHRLESLNMQKLGKFRPEFLYTTHQTTILHSLEALVGLVDFDRISHHCTAEYGVLGSPAATAAYLIHSSNWDSRAEEYLQRVVSLAKDENGGVPSGFPTPNFELSWALSTILMNDENLVEEHSTNLQPLKDYFNTLISNQGGLIGFAPGILPDADDTARCLLTAELLGEEVDFSPIISKFRAEPCFKTYEMERNPSFSANCNVLLALVSSKNTQSYGQEIEAISKYLLTLWRTGNVSDKWNRSSHYSFMLLSSAFVRLLQQYEAGQLPEINEKNVVRSVALCLCQILSQNLAQQSRDGSWENSLEVTSYCVLTMAQLMRLPFEGTFKDGQLRAAISRGQQYIKAHQDEPLQPVPQDYLWIEKISYSSRLLRKVYPILALNANCESLVFNENLSRYFTLPPGTRQMKKLFQFLPLFRASPPVSWDLALLEASLWSRYLHESKHAVFPPIAGQKGQDKYIGLIPLTFTACNQAGNHALSPDTVWDMIFISLLVYQVDEYMESIVTQMPKSAIQVFHRRLRLEFGLDIDSDTTADIVQLSETGLPSPESSSTDEVDAMSCDEDKQKLPSLDDVISVIKKLITHILQHPKVLAASQMTQKELSEELYSFLVAHISHISSNIQLAQDKHAAPANYHKWVRSTAAEDTSCPMAALFFLCLTSEAGKFAFEDFPLSRYLSRSVIHHLAVMCRQYNDYGSVARDMDENNLNSLHFADFTLSGSNVCGGDAKGPSQEKKDQLLAIAEFERSCLDMSLAKLEQTAIDSKAELAALRVFVNVTDLYGQIYVQRDFTNRVKTQTGS